MYTYIYIYIYTHRIHRIYDLGHGVSDAVGSRSLYDNTTSYHTYVTIMIIMIIMIMIMIVIMIIMMIIVVYYDIS